MKDKNPLSNTSPLHMLLSRSSQYLPHFYYNIFDVQVNNTQGTAFLRREGKGRKASVDNTQGMPIN